MGRPLTGSLPATAKPEGARDALRFEADVHPDHELTADGKGRPDSLVST